MSEALKRIRDIASNSQSNWLNEASKRQANKLWFKRSSRIALRILREIRAQKPINGMSQKKLAAEMGVSPQYINKVVKGKENLTLETIAKIEQVLGISLIEVAGISNRTKYILENIHDSGNLNSFNSKIISQEKIAYNPNTYTENTDDYGQTG